MTPERSKKKTRTQGMLQNSKWVAGGEGREKETTSYFKTSDMNCPEKENVYTKQSRSVVSWGWKLKDRMTANSPEEIWGSVEKL